MHIDAISDSPYPHRSRLLPLFMIPAYNYGYRPEQIGFFHQRTIPDQMNDGLFGIMSRKESPFSGNAPEFIDNYRPPCMILATFS